MSSFRIENAIQLTRLLEQRKPRDAAFVSNDIIFEAQRAARIIHHHDERRCNEDLTCPTCKGDGCKKCADSGDRLGRADARLLDKLRDSLKPYRLRVYEQGDPRGWPLYLIPEESGPESEDDSHYNQRGTSVCPH